jgi:hypothetical protein
MMDIVGVWKYGSLQIVARSSFVRTAVEAIDKPNQGCGKQESWIFGPGGGG